MRFGDARCFTGFFAGDVHVWITASPLAGGPLPERRRPAVGPGLTLRAGNIYPDRRDGVIVTVAIAGGALL